VTGLRPRPMQRARHAIERVRVASSALPPGAFAAMQTRRPRTSAALLLVVRGRSHLKATADFRLSGSAICWPSLQRPAPSDRGLALVSECTSARFCADACLDGKGVAPLAPPLAL
jgi:hypothetical protein